MHGVCSYGLGILCGIAVILRILNAVKMQIALSFSHNPKSVLKSCFAFSGFKSNDGGTRSETESLQQPSVPTTATAAAATATAATTTTTTTTTS